MTIVGDVTAARIVTPLCPIHEARHAWNKHHVDCINPETEQCDPDLDGCYGFEMGSVIQLYKAEPNAEFSAWARAQVLMERILSLQDHRGVVLEEWQDIDLATQ